MLRRLSLALAVAAATTGMAWAESAPQAGKNDLVTVYQEAVKNNADLAAARSYQACALKIIQYLLDARNQVRLYGIETNFWLQRRLVS